MTGLLDTHSFIWWDSDPSKLSPQALAFIADPANTILLSVASVWEMVIKVQRGKLALSQPLAAAIVQHQASGIVVLAATLAHILAVESLPLHHKDPFDRLLIAQANAENAVLVSGDPILSRYAVNLLW
jgi:PIN domain nuclease of toxin-antitoxin system